MGLSSALADSLQWSNRITKGPREVNCWFSCSFLSSGGLVGFLESQVGLSSALVGSFKCQVGWFSGRVGSLRTQFMLHHGLVGSQRSQFVV